MTSKGKVSLRRKARNAIEGRNENEAHNDEDAFADKVESPSARKKPNTKPKDNRNPPGGMISPIPGSANFRSPEVTPSSKYGRGVDDTLNDDKSSQDTPSKWSHLLPDYQSSQADDPGCEVTWDCASPNAIKYLRRLKKGENGSLKEVLKHFKDSGPSVEVKSPPLHLQLLRATLHQQVQQQRNPNPNNQALRKQKRLERQQRRLQKSKEQTEQLCDQLLSAIKERAKVDLASSGPSGDDDEIGAETADNQMREISEENATTDDGNNNNDDDDDEWTDDELFEDNSFIIKATQDPYQFLSTTPKRNALTLASSGTPKRNAPTLASSSTPKTNAPSESNKQTEECFCASNSSSVDSQNSGVIPPTCVPVNKAPSVVGNSGAVLKLGSSGASKLVSTSTSSTASSMIYSGSPSAASVMGTSPTSRFSRRQNGPFRGTPKRLVQALGTENSKDSSRDGDKPAPRVDVLKSVSNTGQQNSVGAHNMQLGPVNKPLAAAANRQQVGTSMQVKPQVRIKTNANRNQCAPLSSVNASTSSSTKSSSLTCTTSNKANDAAPSPRNPFAVSAVSSSKLPDKQPQSTSAYRSAAGQRTKPGLQNFDNKVNNQLKIEKSSGTSTSSSNTRLSAEKLPTVSCDLLDYELSDELMLKLTESDEEFESQAIQLFPTQDPKKLSAPATLTSGKPTRANHGSGFSSAIDKKFDFKAGTNCRGSMNDKFKSAVSISTNVSSVDAKSKNVTSVTANSDKSLDIFHGQGAQSHLSKSDDFSDDLDPEILASICEFDSFSESPKSVKRASNLPKQGPSNSKQPRLQEDGDGVAKSSAVVPKKSGLAFYPSTTNSRMGSSVYKSSNSTGSVQPTTTTSSSLRSLQSSANQPKLAQTKGLSYPAFAQNRQNSGQSVGVQNRLSSVSTSNLAGGGTVSEKLTQSGKKFSFKPVGSSQLSAVRSSSSNSSLPRVKSFALGSHLPAVKSSGSSSHLPNAKSSGPGFGSHMSTGTTHLSVITEAGPSSQERLDSDDEMGDDALYESQIIALLDEVESQVTQQTASQAPVESQSVSQAVSNSQDRRSTSPQHLCSQDQIEAKRQAALQRKMLARTRTK